MRLIDANEVKEYVLKEGFYCDTLADKEHTVELIDILFSTVKAIPIEWVDTYCTDCSIDLRDNDAKAIKKLLEDWKKENERV